MLENYIKKNANSRVVHTLVVHCSATKEGINHTSKDIKTWHLQRGFKDIGYHFIILLDGTIEIGRPLNKIGAHVSEHNKGTIGICYIGGIDKNNKPKDTRTKEQKESLYKIINLLCKYFNIKDIKGHRDYSKDLNGNGKIDNFEFIKECPCFDVKQEYKI